MSTTIDEIIKRAGGAEPSGVRFGCSHLNTDMALRCKVSTPDGLGKGEIVHARSVDKDGKYPNTVHLKERSYWWPVESFDLA
jgi:hypothetical protein